ncbi:helix-turn-helix domain-containing protein [Leptospira ryugenii]|uniref:helix-turn-helix domain-containing protein n=1 Tax=Leptospira ryugenii TaxID=1917863 RepID=UPI000D59A48B|nr:helix-turn-helix domain-containing protein [Leptospira ryugenii]
MVRSGLWIPVWMESLDLTHSQRMLYAEIFSLHKSGGCFASNAHFARVLKLKPDTITRMISKLKKLGFVKQVGFDGRKRTLVPILFESHASAVQDTNPMQRRTTGQVRVGEGSTPAKDEKRPSCTLKVQSKHQHKSWEGFKDFVKIRFSKSTFDELSKVLNPDLLQGNLSHYYRSYLALP